MRKKLVWIISGVVLALIVLALWRLEFFSWQKLDVNRIRNYSESTVMYDKDGEKMAALYSSENRLKTKLSSIPGHVISAFITAEDQRFFEHNGIDVRRIFAALLHNVKTMSFGQGASTITQQLIKNTHLSSEKTLSRKAQEIILALQLEKKMVKQEILEAYLNTVYFGNGAYGVATAAEVYFSKDVGDLTVAEGALLAGIIKSPSNYAPHIQPENALKRRNTILKSMLDTGEIDQNEYEKAVVEALVLSENKKSASAGSAF